MENEIVDVVNPGPATESINRDKPKSISFACPCSSTITFPCGVNVSVVGGASQNKPHGLDITMYHVIFVEILHPQQNFPKLKSNIRPFELGNSLGLITD